jgi:hypothetical protein
MRKKLMMVVASIAAIAAGTLAVHAHHSFSAEFDGTKQVTLEGTVFMMEFVNPHSWLHIDAKLPDGTVERWKIEGGSPNVMFRLGWTRDTLPIGTKVKVTGNPSKDGAKRMSSRNIQFPDGKKMDMGGSNPDEPKPADPKK